MQTTAQPLGTRPAFYSEFDAPTEYQRTHVAVPRDKTAKPLPLPATSTTNSNPGGSTVISTETPTKHPVGFMAKVENLTHRVGEHLGFGTDTATRWSFYQLPEPLLGEFPAKVVNGAQGYSSGFAFVSQGHLCFSSYTNAQNRAIKVIIPFANIVNITLAQRVKNAAHSTGIVLTPISSLSMKANALQVVTSDNVVHQFFGFRKNVENVFNLLTHAWQTSRGGMTNAGIAPMPIPMQQHQTQQMNALDRNHNGIPDSQERRNPLDRNGDGRVDAADFTNQGAYSTTGLVNSYQGAGLPGTTHYVNNTTSLTKDGSLPAGSAPVSSLPQESRLL
eukprot:TRINITY_DN1138_c0_g1_i1.p1 TRINITY_DN1138_c0_g1~~TRINITY_DN1138_c0_g1_i1.p1  ORF type:complete len:354 (-),score=84.26 TRINITY_DN1138_c0_g1_i1:242-1240(-)